MSEMYDAAIEIRDAIKALTCKVDDVVATLDSILSALQGIAMAIATQTSDDD